LYIDFFSKISVYIDFFGTKISVYIDFLVRISVYMYVDFFG